MHRRPNVYTEMKVEKKKNTLQPYRVVDKFIYKLMIHNL